MMIGQRREISDKLHFSAVRFISGTKIAMV